MLRDPIKGADKVCRRRSASYICRITEEARVATAAAELLLFFSSGRWVKIKLKLTTLPRTSLVKNVVLFGTYCGIPA